MFNVNFIPFLMFCLFGNTCNNSNNHHINIGNGGDHDSYLLSWDSNWTVDGDGVLDFKYFEEHYNLLILSDGNCVIEIKKNLDLVPKFSLESGQWQSLNKESIKVVTPNYNFVIMGIDSLTSNQKKLFINEKEHTIEKKKIDDKLSKKGLVGVKSMIDGIWYSDGYKNCSYQSMTVEFIEDRSIYTFTNEGKIESWVLLYFIEDLDMAFFENGKVLKLDFFAEDMESDVGKITVKYANQFEDLVICDFFR